jgi:group II intron reverse transcriptase/maturase
MNIDLSNDEELGNMWREINFNEAEAKLLEMQKKITEWATKYKHHCKRAGKCQKDLIKSLEARVLAVKYVSENAKTPGIDKVLWKSDADRMRAALLLENTIEYKAKPSLILVIHNNDKDRRIQLPTVFDRAMQVLIAYSLDPVSEATADKKSFSARKGRSLFDLHSHFMRTYETEKEVPKYIVKADVKMYYGTISHKWLMNNIPINQYIFKQFLQSGYILDSELYPSDEIGISLGTSLSPIIANMVLDGAQKEIYDGLHGGTYNIDYADGNLFRFADDFLVTARTYESAIEILKILEKFIRDRGLGFSAEKTQIIDIRDGFDFLSRHYKYDKLMEATPSNDAIQKMEQSLRNLINNHSGSQNSLIDSINRKLIGWSAYHKVTNCKDVFKHIDNVVKALLLNLCEKNHPKMSREKIISKYFYKDSNDREVYFLNNKSDVRILQLSDITPVNHIPARLDINPYMNQDYKKNTDEISINNVVGKYKSIWTRQDGKCFLCGKDMLVDQRKSIILINAERSSSTKNSAYIHASCSLRQVEHCVSEYDIYNHFELMELLNEMKDGKIKQSNQNNKYHALIDYISNHNKSIITLGFKEIEGIINMKLCKTAYKEKSFWQKKGNTKISYCWLSNGYRIKGLDIEKNVIMLERISKQRKLNIPEIFITGNLPDKARAEIEACFRYVKKKYGM